MEVELLHNWALLIAVSLYTDFDMSTIGFGVVNGLCIPTWSASSISGTLNCPIFLESKGSAKEVQAMTAAMAVKNHGRQCRIEAFAILGSW